MIASIYHYATLPLVDVEPCFRVPVPPDSFLSQDGIAAELSLLLKSGYRWIRTDGEFCIFEKTLREGIPTNKTTP